jgi:hypothetical protein
MTKKKKTNLMVNICCARDHSVFRAVFNTVKLHCLTLSVWGPYQATSSKAWPWEWVFTSSHGVTSRKNWIFSHSRMKTSNLSFFYIFTFNTERCCRQTVRRHSNLSSPLLACPWRSNSNDIHVPDLQLTSAQFEFWQVYHGFAWTLQEIHIIR